MATPTTFPATSRFPLDAMPSSQSGRIVALSGGRGFVSRLAALGFLPGAPVDMVRNDGRGPVIVKIRQARVALGRGEAMKIIVERDALT
jgi:ferrous iron transport protein A